MVWQGARTTTNHSPKLLRHDKNSWKREVTWFKLRTNIPKCPPKRSKMAPSVHALPKPGLLLELVQIPRLVYVPIYPKRDSPCRKYVSNEDHDGERKNESV
ncbi:hypothetical protein NL108_012795 [Boleophthalmus pectinirostris]|nr:hypothetical protein NL108_012795 [Boleophthalmus pectinirostris]